MIVFKNICFFDGSVADLVAPSKEEHVFCGENLLALPALIDPHVHFRTPGMEYKENWRSGAKVAIRGGCSTVFDMPNTLPPTVTKALLEQKIALIKRQLDEAALPLRYHLFFGADKNHLAAIHEVHDKIIGIKVFMGCSTGNLVIDDDESLEKVFAIAAIYDLVVAVHAEDEKLIKVRKAAFRGELSYRLHSQLRDVEVAVTAVAKALALAKKHNTKLYILHVSTKEEIALIKAAKLAGVRVYAETTPHHLFFSLNAYRLLQGRAVVNPPLRDKIHHEALWQAIHEGIIDTIGSDHAPHTLEEKLKPYGECPSGMPGLEFMLPLLLNAHHKKLISLAEIVALTSRRVSEIFNLTRHDDWVVIDLNKKMRVKKTLSRCGWTPYQGLTLTGWPIYTIAQGQGFAIN